MGYAGSFDGLCSVCRRSAGVSLRTRLPWPTCIPAVAGIHVSKEKFPEQGGRRLFLLWRESDTKRVFENEESRFQELRHLGIFSLFTGARRSRDTVGTVCGSVRTRTH